MQSDRSPTKQSPAGKQQGGAKQVSFQPQAQNGAEGPASLSVWATYPASAATPTPFRKRVRPAPRCGAHRAPRRITSVTTLAGATVHQRGQSALYPA